MGPEHTQSSKCYFRPKGTPIQQDTELNTFDKKGAEKFRKAFDVALSEITIWGVRGCAKKYRQYNLAYLVSHANQLAARRAENPTDPDNNSTETNWYSIDDMMKESLDPVSYKTLNNTRDSFKTHRNVADMQGAAESLRQIIQGTIPTKHVLI